MRFLPFELKLSKIYKSWVKNIVWFFLFFIEKFFSCNIFWCFLFSPNSSWNLSTSLDTQLCFLSLLKKKNTERKHLHSHPKIYKSKTSKTKYTVELILCCSTTPGHGTYHEVWAVYPVRLHWRKLIFICGWISIADRVLVRCRTLCSCRSLSAWTCADFGHANQLSASSDVHQSCCVWKTHLQLLHVFPSSA